MEDFVGKTLNEVTETLQKQNKKFVVKENNHNVVGDTILVTNVQELEDETVVLTVGNFILNL